MFGFYVSLFRLRFFCGVVLRTRWSVSGEGIPADLPPKRKIDETCAKRGIMCVEGYGERVNWGILGIIGGTECRWPNRPETPDYTDVIRLWYQNLAFQHPFYKDSS